MPSHKRIMINKCLCFFLFLCITISAFSQIKLNSKSIIASFPATPDSLKSFVDSTFKSCSGKNDSLKLVCVLDAGYKFNGLNYMKTVCLADKVVLVAEQQHNYSQMARAFMLLGYSNFWISNYEKALSYYFSSLTLYQQLKDKKEEAGVMTEIGVLCSKSGRRKEAKTYFINALNISREINNEGGVADLYSQIGGMCEYDNNLKEAMDYYFKSYYLYRKLNSDLGSSYSADFIASTYLQFQKYDSAIYYEKLSLDLRIKVKDKHAENISINNLGEIYFAKKEYKKALDYFSRSTELAKKSGFVDLEQYGYNYLSKCYNELGDFKNAFKYQKLHSEMKDSIYNQTRSKQLAELQTKYETEKKDNEIGTLQKEKVINTLKLEEQNLILQKRNYLLIVVLLLLIILSTGTYFWYSGQKLKNSIAKEKTIKETEENERLRIAKDIHDDLGSGLSKINFLSEIIYNKSEHLPEIRHSSLSVKETAKRMIENMRDLIWALNPDNTTLPNLIARIREYTTDYLEDIPITVFYLMPENIPNYSINKESHRELFMIVKESLNNISRHSKASEVKVSIVIKPNEFILSIKDNGIGFSEDSKKGNGLRNMNSRIEAIGGKFDIKSETNKFTEITVIVPLDKIIKS